MRRGGLSPRRSSPPTPPRSTSTRWRRSSRSSSSASSACTGSTHPSGRPASRWCPASGPRPRSPTASSRCCRGIGKRPSDRRRERRLHRKSPADGAVLRGRALRRRRLASPRDIDEVVRSCFGFRLPYFGPFQIADMAGLDVYEAVIEQHQRGLGERFEVPEMLRALVRAGHTGTVQRLGLLRLRAGRVGDPARRARPALRRAERPAAGAAAARVRGRRVPGVVDASVLVIGGGAVGGVTAALMDGKVRRRSRFWTQTANM